MKQPKNEAIGEVECPHKGCTARIPVYRFRQRTAARSIFAGKLYADCPVHGRHGADGKAGTQEYLLENAKIWGDQKPKPALASIEPAPPSAKPAAVTPETVASVRAVSPAPAEPAPARPKSSWRTLLG